MPNEGDSELYFIAAMMVLIVILCVIATVIFFRTYRKEMRERDAQRARKQENASEDTRQK
jgi:hypothetical protein